MTGSENAITLAAALGRVSSALQGRTYLGVCLGGFDSIALLVGCAASAVRRGLKKILSSSDRGFLGG